MFAYLVTLLMLTPTGTSSTPGQSWGDGDREYFQWRGRVDGVDDIIIRGRSVRIEHVAAQPIQREDHRFSAALPSAEVDLRLEVKKGRGEVRIMEYPSRRNDYTAVVRVDDGDKGGDADYEFELSWESEDDDGNDWNKSTFKWRGKVDIACEIEIHGRSHDVKDEGGSGTQERSASFSDPLPEEDVAVSVKKVHGRGKVRIVQQPSSRNDFTAVIRIEDDKGGSDDYEIEVSWSE